MITPTHYLLVGVLLFVIGAMTVVARRRLPSAVLGVEVMFQGVILTLAALTSWFQDWEGEIALFVVMALAAVELAVGLGWAVARSGGNP